MQRVGWRCGERDNGRRRPIAVRRPLVHPTRPRRASTRLVSRIHRRLLREELSNADNLGKTRHDHAAISTVGRGSDAADGVGRTVDPGSEADERRSSPYRREIQGRLSPLERSDRNSVDQRPQARWTSNGERPQVLSLAVGASEAIMLARPGSLTWAAASAGENQRRIRSSLSRHAPSSMSTSSL